MALVKVGNLAPVFSLLDQNGKNVSLKDFRDKKNVVVYFYPKAMTPGCTVQAQGIRDSLKEFSKLKTEVLAISPDAVVRLEKFCTRDALNFTLLLIILIHFELIPINHTTINFLHNLYPISNLSLKESLKN